MDRLKILQISALFVSFIGILVMAGWIFDILILKSILPIWVTMKFVTAFSFFISGIIIFSLTYFHSREGIFFELLLPICLILLSFISFLLLVSSFVGFSLGIEELIVQEKSGAVESIVPGFPSIGTILSFILISLAGLFLLIDNKYISYLKICGVFILLLGFIAILGYLIGQKVLYYSIEGLSGAMAVHTAILFIICGVIVYFIGNDFAEAEKNENKK